MLNITNINTTGVKFGSHPYPVYRQSQISENIGLHFLDEYSRAAINTRVEQMKENAYRVDTYVTTPQDNAIRNIITQGMRSMNPLSAVQSDTTFQNTLKGIHNQIKTGAIATNDAILLQAALLLGYHAGRSQ